jgi:hypothetical protein
MFLGPSETIGTSTDLFETVGKRWKIFRRKENVVAFTLPEIPTQRVTFSTSAMPAMPAATKDLRLPTIIERMLLNRFAPASVVVNERVINRQGKLLGVISTHYKTPRRPDDHGLRLLDLLAQQTAEIVQRATAGRPPEQDLRL